VCGRRCAPPRWRRTPGATGDGPCRPPRDRPGGEVCRAPISPAGYLGSNHMNGGAAWHWYTTGQSGGRARVSSPDRLPQFGDRACLVTLVRRGMGREEVGPRKLSGASPRYRPAHRRPLGGVQSLGPVPVTRWSERGRWCGSPAFRDDCRARALALDRQLGFSALCLPLDREVEPDRFDRRQSIGMTHAIST
jgi:hypothetical protein